MDNGLGPFRKVFSETECGVSCSRMLPDVSDEQRHMIRELGLPLPVMDRQATQCFMLLPVELLPDPLGGFSATISGIDVTGGGDSAEEAMVALSTVLQTYFPLSG